MQEYTISEREQYTAIGWFIVVINGLYRTDWSMIH